MKYNCHPPAVHTCLKSRIPSYSAKPASSNTSHIIHVVYESMISYANIWTTNDCFAATTTNYAPWARVQKVFSILRFRAVAPASRSSRPRSPSSTASTSPAPRSRSGFAASYAPAPAGSSRSGRSPEALRVTSYLRRYYLRVLG